MISRMVRTPVLSDRAEFSVTTSESEIVDAVFQSEKSIRGEPVESCKLRYFNSFEFFDHTANLCAHALSRSAGGCLGPSQRKIALRLPTRASFQLDSGAPSHFESLR
jgi:hypothetical protein